MAKLSGSLKDEELFGGFDSDPNDDTFMLAGDTDYPGEVPDFKSAPDESVPVANSEEELEVNYEGVTKAPMISLTDQPDAESVWDMFGQPETGQEQAEQVPEAIINEEPGDIYDELMAQADEPEALEEDIIPPPEQEELAEPEIFASERETAEQDEFIDSERIEIEDEEPIPEPENESLMMEEPVAPDSLEYQPGTEEPYSSGREIPEPEEDSVGQDEKFEIAVRELDEPSEESLNQSIENIEEYEEISLDDDFKKQILNDLENSKKKKKKDEQEDVIVKKVSLSEEEPVAEKITFDEFKAEHPSTFGIHEGEEEGEDDEDSSGKERRKIVIPWKYISYAAAILVIITGLSIGGYYVVTQTDLFTAGTEEEAIPKPAADTTKKKEIAKAVVKPKKDTVKAVTKEMPKIDSIPKAVAQNTYKPVKPRWETTDIPEKKVHERPVPENKHAVKTIVKSEKVQKPVKQAGVSPHEQIYTVELYSTPSADDAKMWVQKLKSRNLENINITQHKLRDKTIYKIRFGKFASRDEAKTEALKLGYPQTWVDRVK